MAVNLSPVGGVAAQFFTSTGAVLTGGKLYTYAAGTTTPVATYISSNGLTAWTNPIVLDAAGRVPGSGEIWLTNNVNYKFVLKDSNDVLIATYDNITGINSVDASQVNYTPPFINGTATNVEAKLAQYVSVKDFGAVGDGVANDTQAIQSAITACLANKQALYFPGGTYNYSSATTFNIDTSTDGFLMYGDGREQTVINLDANNVIFNVKSIFYAPFVAKDVTFKVANPLANTDATTFYFAYGNAYGTGFLFDRVNFTGFTNCAIHAIRAYNSGAKDCWFLGTSNYTQSSGLLPLDDACVRIWGADGTLTVQDHSFSNLCTFERCNFSSARYGVDGWGLCASTFTSCTFNYTWIGFLNRPAPTSAGGNISSTDKSGYNKAFACLVSCWYEDNAKYHYSNVDVSTTTGNDVNPSYVSKIALFQNADEYNFGVNRYQDFLQSSSYRGYVNANGGTLPTNHVFFNGITNNESGFDVTYYDFQKGSAYVNPPLTVNDVINAKTISVFNSSAGEVARFMGNSTVTNANGFRVLCSGTTNRHTRLISGLTQTLAAYETDTGNKAADAPLALDFIITRPGVDNTSKLGEASYRWSEVFAANGTINTSDAREKQDIEPLNDAEKRVAVALKALVKKFRFKDSVVKKQDKARIHVGVIAQEVVSAFEAEGLDAMRYGIVCYDEWKSELDPDGNEILVAGNRYGIRYEQLLAFIISAI